MHEGSFDRGRAGCRVFADRWFARLRAGSMASIEPRPETSLLCVSDFGMGCRLLSWAFLGDIRKLRSYLCRMRRRRHSQKDSHSQSVFHARRILLAADAGVASLTIASVQAIVRHIERPHSFLWPRKPSDCRLRTMPGLSERHVQYRERLQSRRY